MSAVSEAKPLAAAGGADSLLDGLASRVPYGSTLQSTCLPPTAKGFAGRLEKLIRLRVFDVQLTLRLHRSPDPFVLATLAERLARAADS